jgi:hypothetical protein
MAAVALEEFEDFIRSKIEKERWTHSQLIEHHLQLMNPQN